MFVFLKIVIGQNMPSVAGKSIFTFAETTIKMMLGFLEAFANGIKLESSYQY